MGEFIFLFLNLQLEDKKTARKRFTCITDDECAASGRQQAVQTDVELHTVSNEAKDSKHSVADGKISQESEKGRKLPLLVSSDASEDCDNEPDIKR